MKIKLMEDSIGEDELKAIDSCLKSGEYTQGKIVDEFEKKFAEWNGSKYAVMVNSGSSANLLIIALLKHKYGLNNEEIIVPSVTWPTTVYPILQNSLVPVFCDVDGSFNLDIDSLKRMTGPKTKGVFLVHLLGQSARVDEIKKICDEKNLFLVEDCCESLGAKYKGINVGNFGEMGSFSFYFGHHITSIEGGMIVTNNFETYDLLKSMRSHGWTRGSQRAEKYPERSKDFTFDMLGYNLRSTNLNASIGLAQLEKLDNFLKTRIENHRYFLERIKEMGLSCQEVSLDETSSFSLAVLFDNKKERDYILRNLPLKGVECRSIVSGNLLKQPFFDKLVQKRSDETPMANRIDECGVYLPNNQFITPEKIDYMLGSIKETLKECKLEENSVKDNSFSDSPKSIKGFGDFWKDKKVLVTGGGGFLGSFLIPKLEERRAKVFVFGRKEYDLTKESDVSRLFEDVKPEIVIHLAVDGGGIGYMKNHPGSVFDNNILMNTLVQKYAREKGVQKFVGIGTVCSYPKFTPIPFKEENLWEGYPEETNAPYGLAKKMMLVQSQGYREQYGFNAIHLLLINLYGPRDDFHPENSHVIPALIKKFCDDKPMIEIWGSGKASREFLYAEDAAEAIILSAEKYNKSEPVNIGSGEEISIAELVKKIVVLTNFKGEIKWDMAKPDGQLRRCLDTSKAEKEFGFKAKTNLDEGLRSTIDWYKEDRKSWA